MPLPDLRTASPLWLVPIALVVALPLGVILGRGPFFLALAAFAVLGAIWVFWKSLQSLTGEAPLTLEEALGLAAPNAEEERKLSVLRALKDLEYERSVGKIDEHDFQELSQKYRAEAKHLLQLVDETMAQARQKALAELEERLKDEPELQTEKPAQGATKQNDAKDAPGADQT
jgi:hypothetical protein